MKPSDEIENAYRAFKRGGHFLVSIFENKTRLSGEDCLYLFNTYGINTRDVILMGISHNCIIDTEEFSRLLEEQIERSKNMVQC